MPFTFSKAVWNLISTGKQNLQHLIVPLKMVDIGECWGLSINLLTHNVPIWSDTL